MHHNHLNITQKNESQNNNKPRDPFDDNDFV